MRPPGYFDGPTVVQIFERRAKEFPNRAAVSDATGALTYQELNSRANRLARCLESAGTKPGHLVGLLMERRSDLLVGLLAIMKVGAAYVPIDPAYPRERIEFILADAGVHLLLTSATALSLLPNLTAPVFEIESARLQIENASGENLCCERADEDLAYVIYTSGSTGQPKGSLITHSNLKRLFTATDAWFQFNERDVWTLFHSIAFDFSVWEVWGAWLYGGEVIVVPFEVSRSPETFHRLLHERKVTVLNQTPSAFRQLIRADEKSDTGKALELRYVIFGGEALDLKTLQAWYDRHGDQTPKLINMYGITETTVHVTYRPLSRSDINLPSVIGVPIPDLKLYLLNDRLEPVALGKSGELCVVGAGLGRGYLNRDDLTASKFIWAEIEGQKVRLYRSGDLAQYLPSGELEYLGRIDHQVKIRGFRIETGEIESIINLQSGVRESLVIAREDPRGEKRLVAYIIPRSQSSIAPAGLRLRLREKLPEYMVPSALVEVAEWPLTTNGKLDRAALPDPWPVKDAAAAPGTPSGSSREKEIASIWADVLGHSNFGLEHNFFDVGGNSLHLAEIQTRLQTHLARQVPIIDLFAHPTIRSVANYLDSYAQKSPNAASDRAQKQRLMLANARSKRAN